MSTEPHPPLAMPKWPNSRTVPADELAALVEEWGELGESHVQEAKAYIDAGTPALGHMPLIKRVRQAHHRIAQLLASGVPAVDVSRIVGMTPDRIRQLKDDPAFAELLTHYKAEVADEWMDFVTASKNLSLDIVEEMSHRLETAPESIPFSALNEALKTVADRSGNGPVNKNVNLNLNAGVAERLRRARGRRLAVAGPTPGGIPSIDADFTDE